MLEEQLKRIADALETIAAKLGADAPAKPAKASKPAATPSEPDKKKVGKEPEPDPDGPTKEDVRAALVALAEAKDARAGKAILKAQGVSTLEQLDPAKYQVVLDEIEKATP